MSSVVTREEERGNRARERIREKGESKIDRKDRRKRGNGEEMNRERASVRVRLHWTNKRERKIKSLCRRQL